LGDWVLCGCSLILRLAPGALAAFLLVCIVLLFEFGEFAVPKDPAIWQQERPSILGKVKASLGDLPPRPAVPEARVISKEIWRDFNVEKVTIPNGADGTVTALLLVPQVVAANVVFSRGSSSSSLPRMLTESRPLAVTPWRPRPVLGPQNTLVLLIEFSEYQ
jgi:hypothetical protein